MAGLQSSNKHFTDSSNTNPALTTASTHYPQPPRHPTTPTSPAPPLSNTTTPLKSSPETPRSNKGNNNTSPSNPTTTTNTSTNSSSNPTSPAGPRSLTSTATQTTPQPHSAFSPYNQVPPHPTPVTTPTSTKNSISQPEPPTMMTTSHLDNSGSTTLIYPPQHTHFNPTTTPFWPSWNFNNGSPANGAAVLSATGGSAFVPAVGYGAGSNMAPGHNPRPKLTTTIWEDEGTLCYQVDARGICVARRQDNNMINGTKLLNVVGMSRGKRDGILKNEKGRVVVKVGAMHLKGVWITFARAKTLATQFKISELLYPLFVDDPSVFLHNSYGQSMTRIPALNNGSASQWRPTHPYANNFNSTSYTPETTRQWYPYGNGNPLMGSPNGPHGQEHSSVPFPPATAYGERPQNVANPPAVPMYQPPRNHGHPQAHLEEYEQGYGLINGQSQGQQGVTVVSGPAVSSYHLSPTDYKNASTAGYYSIPQNSAGTNSSNFYTPVKTEENPASNGNGYMRPQGLYNLVSAADVVGGSPAQGSPPQLIGQKRGFVSEEENDDYNVNNSSQPSPPLAMHPPTPLSGIAVSNAVNAAAAGSFPSPMNVSPNSSPGNSAFSGWNHHSKRIKYEFPEANTPSSSQSSPRNNITGGYQLPGLGSGPATPGANPSTPQAYTSSNLQMVTNAQSPHHYSSTTGNGGPATGTTTPTTEGLDRYLEQGAVLHTPSPDNVGNTPEDSRRYEQYRQREDPPATEEINGGWD
ncbi:16586_t:CDS:2 [Acaulospora colombiana]|uniref:16586_t:CDS:1 n=1 Tax=Acaulospora colombiana TaxID=27376 RepID=A0ACA9L6V8_9GLOM|nr:16586_t:CDS:2 [Acaulospora colombiana]